MHVVFPSWSSRPMLSVCDEDANADVKVARRCIILFDWNIFKMTPPEVSKNQLNYLEITLKKKLNFLTPLHTLSKWQKEILWTTWNWRLACTRTKALDRYRCLMRCVERDDAILFFSLKIIITYFKKKKNKIYYTL